jgi:hypothetical protein
MVTNSAEDSPVWAAGPDGTTVPWLPVALPGVGVGYVPADYFPAQGLAAAAAAAAAGKAQHEGGHPSEGSISLCGGMGLSPGMVQLQLQEQQQLARELEAATGAAAAGADDDRIGGHPLALRQQAYLQDLPELPQVAACAGGGGGGGTDSTRSSEGVSAVGLPLLPDQGSVGLEGLFLQGSQTMCQGDSYQLHDAPIGVPAAAAAATAEEGLAAQQGAAPGAAAATASRQAAVLAEPGWLSSSVTGQQRQLQGFGLWDGVVAAAAAGTTGSPGERLRRVWYVLLGLVEFE